MSFFGSIFPGGGDGGPGMGDIMKMMAPLLQPGPLKDKINTLVTKYAPDDKIREFAGYAIEGVEKLQKENNQKYVLYVEGTSDNRDILIRVWNRLPDGTLEPIRDLYLSQLTQADLLLLINLFLSDDGEPKRIG